jgi:hypothetical protein
MRQRATDAAPKPQSSPLDEERGPPAGLRGPRAPSHLLKRRLLLWRPGVERLFQSSILAVRESSRTP